MIDEIFKYKAANFNALLKYGFKVKNGIYVFNIQFLNEFTLTICVDKQSKIKTKLIDNKLNEEYVLHLLEDATGSYVGKIKAEFEKILLDICKNCFEDDVFKSKQAKEIIAFANKNYGNKLEFLWEKAPNIAVLRRQDSKKWYAVLFDMPKNKLGVKSDEILNIIDIRSDPEISKKLIDNISIFEGYHMNKKNWITICLDNSIKSNKILELLAKSYDLAKK